MIIGSVGGIVTGVMLILLWFLGDPKSMWNPTGGVNGDGGLTICFFTVALVVLSVLNGCFNNLSGNIVIPMTADCADYEVYRTGRYVPGMMGTLFSFVDKLISSAAPVIAGAVFSMVGYADKLPDQSSPYSEPLMFAAVFLTYGLIIIGQVCNLVAMKFYPLNKEKMEEILLAVFTGWMGGHRFYARQWPTAILYLLLFWCGFPLAMTIVDILLAQNVGSKAFCIAELLKKGYDKDKVLMTGDAPGDLDAAKRNGVFYYPILVRHEGESWTEFKDTAVDKLVSGTYGGAYQEEKTAAFLKNLS